MVKTTSNKSRICVAEPANDNPVMQLEALQVETSITITELEVMETYMQDILSEMIAANDNDANINDGGE